MGFGILFIGYIFTYLLSMSGNYGYYPAIIGYVVMLYALTKLVEYEPRFKYAFIAVIPLILCTGFKVFLELATVFNLALPEALLGNIAVDIVKAGFDMLYHAALLLSISKIAADTGVEKTSRAAVRNLIIYAVFFAAETLQIIIPDTEANATLNWYILILVLVLWLIWLVLDSVTIFSCYMRICDENDVDMPYKESKFGFINKFRAEFDKREERAIQRNRDYHTEKVNKRIARINAGKKKKKK